MPIHMVLLPRPIVMKVDAAGFLHGMDRDDVGMVERREGTRLALEALESLRVGGHVGRQHLQCYIPVERGVPCAVVRVHPSLAELVEDFVVRDGLADHDRATRSSVLVGRSMLLQQPENGQWIKLTHYPRFTGRNGR